MGSLLYSLDRGLLLQEAGLPLSNTSPTSSGARPRGLILGVRAGVAPISLLLHFRCTTLTSLGSNFSGLVEAPGVG